MEFFCKFSKVLRRPGAQPPESLLLLPHKVFPRTEILAVPLELAVTACYLEKTFYAGD